jgi:pyruvate/2-oxoglutarate/acetoin dehydrogenase E1 component
MPVIIRAVVGGKKPLDTGIQHTQDYTKAMKEMISFPIVELNKVSEIIPTYKKALKSKGPIMIIEKRDLYESE